MGNRDNDLVNRFLAERGVTKLPEGMAFGFEPRRPVPRPFNAR